MVPALPCCPLPPPKGRKPGHLPRPHLCTGSRTDLALGTGQEWQGPALSCSASPLPSRPKQEHPGLDWARILSQELSLVRLRAGRNGKESGQGAGTTEILPVTQTWVRSPPAFPPSGIVTLGERLPPQSPVPSLARRKEQRPPQGWPRR